jgi:hypothetical protein
MMGIVGGAMKKNYGGLSGLVLLCVSGIISAQYVQTPADQAEVKNLLQQADSIKGKEYSQSEAHMSVPSVQKLMSGMADLARNKRIIDETLAKERELQKTHYVFYTAVPYMRLFQDVTRKLYKKKVGNVGALKDKSFQFIRYTYDDPIYKEYKNATDFLVKEITQNGIIDDNDIRLKTILVATNLALFANIRVTGESTWDYLNHPQAWVQASSDRLEAALKSFGYPTSFTKRLMELAPLIQHDQGELFQIFIPKNMVDDVGYVSWRQGIPFDPELIKRMFGRALVKADGVNPVYHDEIDQRIYTIKRQWKAKDREAMSMVNTMLDHAKRGDYRLSPVLQQYQQNPAEVFGINYQQGRLLVTDSMLLNPTSGIKIYRYSNVSQDKVREYKKKLRHIMLEMHALKARLTSKA